MGQSYDRITKEDRITLAALREANFPVKQIADQLGRPRQTLYAELNRNTGQRNYRPRQAQQRADARQARKPHHRKRTARTLRYVNALIRREFSPEQIAAVMKLRVRRLVRLGVTPISHETIYQHIYADKAAGGTLYTHLRQRRKKRKPRRDQPDRRGQIKNRIPINKRPKSVQHRRRIGHWEADLMSGKAHRGFLVTLVERKSRRVRIGWVLRKTAEATAAEIVRLLADERVKTITFDNGKEFAGHEEIARRLRCKCYFADPYSSWQRGTNENTNGLIRQYFSKGMSLVKVAPERIAHAERRLNHRPRKCLAFRTPTAVYFSRAG